MPVIASAASAATNALPDGLSPATRQAALKSGYPNPDQKVALKGAIFPGGGVQISDDSIAYQGGTAILTAGSGPASSSVTPNAVFMCPSSQFCLYRNSNYDTPSGQTWFHSQAPGGTTYQLSAYNYNDTDSSWINNRGGNVRVHNNWPLGASDWFQATAGSQAQSLASQWNDEGSGLSYGS